ncbi:MAG TPA: hypothetical protein VMB51_16175 [Solirubrobacteraceae bacterium]|nr:hypothetical protein [Solirubrobacteraceae bacterium]
MYQCSSGAPVVSPGWSAYGSQTKASTVLSNQCSSGGSLGVYAYSNGDAGAVEEDGSNGSEIGLQLVVPGSVPDVSIDSITATVHASPVTGDDAWLGFASEGQELPGGIELAYGGNEYTNNDSWTLPQGARQWQADVFCSTDHSSPTCDFADTNAIPALSDITLTLQDNTPPSIVSATGGLASAAASNATVTGSQTLNFAGTDADSGVRSATLTLTPQNGTTPYTHTWDFSAECAYDSWNACPTTQTVNTFALETAALKDDAYTVNLTVTDAANNTTTDDLGTITTHNAPTSTTPPTILTPGQLAVGSTLSSQPGGWSAPAGAGTITYTYQWQDCDTQGNNCQSITGAQNPTYTTTTSDAGHTLRLLVNATNNDGTTTTSSPPTTTIPAQEPSSTPPAPTTTNPVSTNTNTPTTTNTANTSTSVATNTPSSTTGQAGTTSPNSTTPPAGIPNGTSASNPAILQVNTPTTLTTYHTQKAFRLTGQLDTTLSTPIAYATLDVLQETIGSSTFSLIAHATTNAFGAFALTIPAGPSRTIKITYRALSNEPDYAATALIHENVNARIHLTIINPTTGRTLHHTTPTGKITLTGHVEGPIPPQGTLVVLIVEYQGSWQPFRYTYTNANGTFRKTYQFKGAIGSFPFRARTPTGQADYPYSLGESNIVNVSTR